MDIDLSGDGGVLKKILKPAKEDAIGVTEALPIAEVHYVGRLHDTNEVFDSSREDNTVFSFEVGKGKVIRAWDLAFKTMKVGELAVLTCRADYAYGESGSPPEIPPNATLVFEVELMDVKPPKGTSVRGAAADRDRLSELKRNRELAAAKRADENKKREEAKAAAAARVQAKLEAKKGGKGKKK